MREAAPDFLLIGAMKAGTTTLYDALDGHGGFNLPSLKEPRILRSDWSQDRILKEYRKHFRGGSGLRGDGSTYYSMLPDFPDVSAIAREIMGPDGKIVYIVRKPASRIASHLMHDVAIGRIDPDFEIHRVITKDSRFFQWTRYRHQLESWFAAFGTANCLIVDFDDLVGRQAVTVEAVCRFLGETPTETQASVHSNANDVLVARLKSPVVDRLRQTSGYQKLVRPVARKLFGDRLRAMFYGEAVHIRLDDKRRSDLGRNALVAELDEEFTGLHAHESFLKV